MTAAIIIPARLGSTRLARKLLRDLAGKSVLQRTYEQASKARRAGMVLIAAADAEIAEAAIGFGAKCLLTDPALGSGTERVAAAARQIAAEIIINVQGDEPEIDPAHIDALIETHESADVFASTLACPFPQDQDPQNPAAVKAVLGRKLDGVPNSRRALYFTRAPAPFPRAGESEFHLHIGAYAFRPEALFRFAAAPPGRLEQIEQLEQLRILEMGESVAVRIVDRAARGIDTMDDLEAARKRFAGA
jgi:3-deoxy-manno-octulosonate cytidylyltransferase (CMP-KDO synthetase)